MESMEMKPKQVIGNVVNLDLRTATEESVAGIASIGNVVNLFCTPETAHLVGTLKVGNIVNRIEAPADAKIQQGQWMLTREMLSSDVPLSIMVMGQMVVDPALSSEEIETGVSYLGVCGNVLCPEHLAAAIQAKLEYLVGPVHTYPQGAQPVMGKLTLDVPFLRGLEDDTELMVIGRLEAKQVLPNDLLARKLKAIHVADGVVCREENADVLLPRLDRRSGADKVTVIPADFQMVERALELNAAVLGALPTRNLYCTELVQIDAGVTPEELDATLDALIAKELVICPATLSSVMAKKLDVLETDVIFYEGKLLLVKDESTLSDAHFSSLDERVTLVVLGHLHFADSVTPKLLADHLLKVHNFGAIEGTPDQLAILQFKLGTQEGAFLTASSDGEEDVHEEEGTADDKKQVKIGNIVNLKL